jgi:hypothetical protein
MLYSAYYWPLHLDEILRIRNKIDPCKRKETGRLLVRALRDEAAIARIPRAGREMAPY